MNLSPDGYYWAYTEYTTDAQKEQNAQIIYQILSNTGWQQDIQGNIPAPAWTLTAISGLLGNAEAESQINPGLYAGRIVSPTRAFGVVQWWPARKIQNWLSSLGKQDYDLKYQLARLYYEENAPSGSDDHDWYIETRQSVLDGWGPYSISEQQFWTDTTHTPEWLAQAWLFNYERPDRPARYANYRGRLARKWYNFLTDNPAPDPDPPSPTPEPGQRNILWWLWRMHNITIKR